MSKMQRAPMKRLSKMVLLAGILFSAVFSIYPSVSAGKEASGQMKRVETKQYTYDVNCNWLGLSYNLVYMDPDNYAAPAFKNPNLSIPPAVFTLKRGTKSGTALNGTSFIIPEGVNFYPGSANSVFDSSYQVIKSGNDFRNEMHGSISLSGGIRGIFSASGSTSFKEVQQRTRNSEERIYQVKGIVEGHRLSINLDSPGELTLSPAFKTDVKKLGKSLSYRDFISNWGTHFASTIVYGGKAYFRLAVNKVFLSKYKLTENEFSTAVKGTFRRITASAKGSSGTSRQLTETEERMSQKVRAVAYGGDGSVIEQDIKAYNEWAESVRNNPTVIRLTLTEYHELLTRNFFPEDNEIQQKKIALKEEIRKYLEEHYVDAKARGSFFETGSDSILSWWDGRTEEMIALDVYGKNDGILHETAAEILPDGNVVFNFGSGNGNSSYISAAHSDLFTRLAQTTIPGYTISLWVLWDDSASNTGDGEALLVKGNSKEDATFSIYLEREPQGNKMLRFTQKVKYHRKRWCRGIGGDKCAKDDDGQRVYTLEKNITGMLIPGKWMHIAAIFDNKWHGETMGICVNGDCTVKDPKRPGRYKCGGYKCQEWAIKNVEDFPKSDLLIGMAPGGADQFRGKMDDIQLFNTVFSKADIVKMYLKGRDKGFLSR